MPLWALRVVWLVLPVTSGSALASALDPRSASVRLVASVGLWLGWFAAVLALLVPRPVGLTVVRVLGPAALAAAAWAGLRDADGAAAGLALVTTAAAAATALLPEVGQTFLNGAAYGEERRHLLRAPGALLLGPIPLAWAVLVTAVVAGPLLLAARQWVLGVIAVALGGPAAVLLGRALHSLTQRWAVFVPAGMVLKDHLALVDPVLFRRTEVEVLHPAPAGSDSLDLTVRSPGLALELRLHDKVSVTRVVPGTRAGEPGRTARLLFTPTRPGAVLDDARTRRIATQEATPPPSTSSPR